MAAGHGTWAGIGGGVAVLGSVPMAVGLIEVHGGHSPFDNVWVEVGTALWLMAACILVGAAGHFVYEWRGARRGKEPALGPSRRSPLAEKGSVSVSLGITGPDGRFQVGAAGPGYPQQQTGALPIRLDCEGIRGRREGDRWEWTISDLVLTNESADRIICRAWLVVREGDHDREFAPTPNDPVVLPPSGHARVSLVFVQDLTFISATVVPGPVVELVLLEVAPKDRDCRVTFSDGLGFQRAIRNHLDQQGMLP